MDSKPLPSLHTPRLTLRAFTPDDAQRVQALLDDPQVAEGTLAIPSPYPEGAASAWIASHAAKWAAGRLAVWAMVANTDGQVVGALSLRVTAAHRRAEAGYWVARVAWGKGYASEALRAAIAFGFDTLGLHRIEAHHFSSNPASGRVMEKVGMRHEGHVREPVFRAGVARDLELYGILRTDPRP
ncbi:MAG: GNAT family protein [Gemmatimonadaceae bacterium]